LWNNRNIFCWFSCSSDYKLRRAEENNKVI
jgi:hypothetical protein